MLVQCFSISRIRMCYLVLAVLAVVGRVEVLSAGVW